MWSPQAKVGQPLRSKQHNTIDVCFLAGDQLLSFSFVPQMEKKLDRFHLDLFWFEFQSFWGYPL